MRLICASKKKFTYIIKIANYLQDIDITHYCRSHIRGSINNEPPHEKTNNMHMRKRRRRFVVTVKLISTFVFATRLVEFLNFLNPKFPVSSCLLCLHSLVCVRPDWKPHHWFSHEAALVCTVWGCLAICTNLLHSVTHKAYSEYQMPHFVVQKLFFFFSMLDFSCFIQQVTTDPRVRLEQKLRDAGLHQTDYARHVMKQVAPPQPPRKDMESTVFKFD